ncbi:MAG TPA: hypothetical protein VND19_01600 [Acetobacteraceae bacterium]|nr:hypothetical protein [Acetobacteraceae bacterium]
MDTILAEQGLSFTYLRDPSKSEAFDPCRILDDLCEDGMAGAMLPWENGLRMAESDHVVLATGTNDERCLGVVAASDLATEREPFLFLDAAYMAPKARASHLLQRMLAFAMLRVAGEAAVPNVIAACVQTSCYARDLREFGQSFTVAAQFPAAPEDIVIDLGMASLARRIVRVVRPGSRCEAATGAFRSSSARHTGGIPNGIYGGISGGMSSGSPGSVHRIAETLVVVDLSAAHEATILEDARKLYRARPFRGTRRGVADAGAATLPDTRHRLRDATAF